MSNCPGGHVFSKDWYNFINLSLVPSLPTAKNNLNNIGSHPTNICAKSFLNWASTFGLEDC